MPALASVVSTYLTTVKNSLTTGSDLGSNIRGAALNYLKAQDMANVLRLLQAALTTGSITATGGSSTTVVCAAATFVAGSQVGNTVTFAGDQTAGLAGVTAVVISNTTTTLTFASLPDTPVAADTFTITGSFVDYAIDALLENKSHTESPAGNIYGDSRLVADALTLMVNRLGGTMPSQTLLTTTASTGTSTTDIKVDTKGMPFKIDQFKGMKVTVSGVARKVVSNTEDTIVVSKGVTAPSGGEAVVVSLNYADDYQFNPHPGGQPGDNARLSALIAAAQAAVVAFTLPT